MYLPADKYIEGVITYVNTELGQGEICEERVNKVREHLGAKFDNIFAQNEKDFDIIHEKVGDEISATTDKLAKQIIGSFTLKDEWAESLRQYTKLLAKDIRKLKKSCESEVNTWAKMTASMSNDWGADAPIVAGLTWIATKAVEFVSDNFDADIDTGPVAEQFVEDNIAENFQEDMGWY